MYYTKSGWKEVKSQLYLQLLMTSETIGFHPSPTIWVISLIIEIFLLPPWSILLPPYILFGLLFPMFRKQQFILMHPSTQQPYRTPDKRPQPDISTKGFSSATSRPWGGAGGSGGSAGLSGLSQYRPSRGREEAIQEKLAWFEKRTEQLKTYLNNSPQIDQVRVREIFGWTVDAPPDEGIQQRVLKDLSTKVRALIKENSELRGSTPTEEVLALRWQKERLEEVIGQLRRGESAREAILSEENQYLREYINRKKDANFRQTNGKDFITIEEESHLTVNNHPSVVVVPPPSSTSQAEVSNLRKYVMAYINTVIEANDQKLDAQKKYLDALEKRVASLTKYEQLFNHLRFERAVNLQESSRKSKNFTAGAPTVSGDHFEPDPDTSLSSPDPPASNSIRPYFAGKIIKQSTAGPDAEATGKEMAALVLRSAQLQQQLTHQNEQLTILQEKYELEIENHIRDSSDREELVITIQKLNAEKTDLKHQLYDMQEHLRAAQKKMGQMEKGAGRLRVREDLAASRGVFSIEDEVAAIKKDLISCGIDNYEAVEQQISHVFAQRDRLRRDLQQLQANRADQSRFSSATKQIFLLRQKNSQLQQNLRFYESQIQQYQQQLRQISLQSEQQLAKAISRDFKEMRAADEELEGLKWPRLAHSCMVSSIARLENIQKQLNVHSNP